MNSSRLPSTARKTVLTVNRVELNQNYNLAIKRKVWNHAWGIRLKQTISKTRKIIESV